VTDAATRAAAIRRLNDGTASAAAALQTLGVRADELIAPIATVGGGPRTSRAPRCTHMHSPTSRCYRGTRHQSGLCAQHQPGRDSLGRVQSE
jgi:hypothetical protein